MILEGLDLGWKGAIGGAVWGGIAGGIDAVNHDRNFWSGADKQYGAYTLKNNGEWAFEPGANIKNNDIYATKLDQVSTINPDGTRSIVLPKTAGKIGVASSSVNMVPSKSGIFSYLPSNELESTVVFWGFRWHHQPLTKVRYLFNDRLATGWKDYFIFW